MCGVYYIMVFLLDSSFFFFFKEILYQILGTGGYVTHLCDSKLRFKNHHWNIVTKFLEDLFGCFDPQHPNNIHKFRWRLIREDIHMKLFLGITSTNT